MKLVGTQAAADDAPHVLIVEDDPELGRLLARMLGRRQVPTLQVRSGQAALLTLEERVVSVVVADLEMPGMDGLSLLTAVASRWAFVHRVLWTGHATSDLIVNGHGIRVLSKSLDTALVVDMLVRLHRAWRHRG
jgi:DNA-binding NtrC family response regulator